MHAYVYVNIIYALCIRRFAGLDICGEMSRKSHMIMRVAVCSGRLSGPQRIGEGSVEN